MSTSVKVDQCKILYFHCHCISVLSTVIHHTAHTIILYNNKTVFGKYIYSSALWENNSGEYNNLHIVYTVNYCIWILFKHYC